MPLSNNNKNTILMATGAVELMPKNNFGPTITFKEFLCLFQGIPKPQSTGTSVET
jgi:hypothetical protein